MISDTYDFLFVHYGSKEAIIIKHTYNKFLINNST